MNILPYKLSTTNDLLTSRAGLITLAQLMQSIGFSNLVDREVTVVLNLLCSFIP